MVENPMVEEPMVSVIMPAFNEEKYIGESIQSLIDQTFEDFELLCIDNGSTDSTVSILQEFARKDPRIRLLSCEGNTGDARNKGIEAANGKYLIFLDSDDLFESTLLEKTVQAAEQCDSQMVLFGGKKFNDKTGAISSKLQFISSSILPKQKVFSAQDVDDRIFQLTNPAAWSKLFLHDFVVSNDLRFQSLPNSNDLFFSYAALSKASRITGLKENLITYRTNKENSIQSNKDTNPLCFFEALRALNDELIRDGNKDAFFRSFTYRLLHTIKYNLSSLNDDHAKEQAFEYLIENWDSWLSLDQDITNYMFSDNIDYLKKYILAGIAQFQFQKTPHPPINDEITCVVTRKAEGTPKISVVVPAYNMQEYVEETLRSISDQTFNDLEIIFIDDGSTDNTLDIATQFAKDDPRMSVYHQPNSGLSVSRNAGLAYAQGDYVYFIDSDDILLPDALKTLFDEIDENDLDAIFFDADSFFDGEDDLESKMSHYKHYYHRSGNYTGVYSGLSLLSSFIENKDYLPSACLYVSKHDLLKDHGAQFVPAIIHEDNAFTFQLMLNAKRVMHVKENPYQRRVRQGSIMTNNVSFNMVYGYFACIKDMYATLLSSSDREDSLTDLREAFNVILNVMKSAQSEYRKLDRSELGGMLALSQEDKNLFEKYIAIDGNRLREIDRYQERIDKLKASNIEKSKKMQSQVNELKSIRNSRSYKLYCKMKKLIKGK